MPEHAAAAFEQHRPMLLRVAYRMLGSMADAEDMVQEAWLRWARAERDAVEVPAAFLRRVVTRLCLDQLNSARARREEYSGPWLPEPVLDEEPEDDVTLPLMLALERLSPLERAAFLLHDVFGESFESIAGSLGRDAAACRQLATRARRNVQAERARFPVQRDEGRRIAEAFFAASRSGNTAALSSLLADQVSFYADGGGKRPAVARVLRGCDIVSRALAAIARLTGLRPTGQPEARVIQYGFINGLPGFVTQESDGEIQTTALLVEQGRIRAIYVMRNPDKLQGLKARLN
ncbi:sigma-70 family RNA polymerase sigma factor [Altererythrobacter sp. CC-YST694]|uniref:sigma-70 family RNA polymerase sigma factor n=1 Tax=Altererythrobacter sp. CC-YST694 TaxID=2755038 RepID=UPI001D02533C|nr:sigma-70 family RNA polymerase sigma factor [Altererythrobacter sp. CC-YST694]MCB5424932.1 sigma-70 family RNA polymerase sigma factor [Altererythrobacter sp. CC-YST694]